MEGSRPWTVLDSKALAALTYDASAGLSKASWYSPITQAQAPTMGMAMSKTSLAAEPLPTSAAPAPPSAGAPERSRRRSATARAYGRTSRTRAATSLNCVAALTACTVSGFLAISASTTTKYHSKSSIRAYLSREPMRRMVPKNSSGEQVFLLMSISFFTVSTKVEGLNMRSKSCSAILRAVVSDSSMQVRTFEFSSTMSILSLNCGLSRTSLNISSARNLRFRSAEFSNAWFFSMARAVMAEPSGMTLNTQRIASISTLCALVVFRRFVRGSTNFAGRRLSQGHNSWKSFMSLIEHQLLVVFTRMWYSCGTRDK
mmetsp:Transcript_12371/g.33952  ORF Transcript_12371/g.33952 Transcript_12371/m.33952 type:complete len:315 (+) Transcript_12371:1780-2724(+)